MSVNCVQCVKRERTGIDMLCDACREADPTLMRIDELQALALVLGVCDGDLHRPTKAVLEQATQAVHELVRFHQDSRGNKDQPEEERG